MEMLHRQKNISGTQHVKEITERLVFLLIASFSSRKVVEKQTTHKRKKTLMKNYAKKKRSKTITFFNLQITVKQEKHFERKLKINFKK